MSFTRRLNIGVPQELDDLFNWFVAYDERFQHSANTAAAYFLAEGIKAAYEQSLRDAEEMSADEFAPLAESQIRALKEQD
jgi:hypothetical protein